MKPKVKKLLEWLAKTDGVLESQITGSGLSRALDAALIAGFADNVDIGVKERSGIPAAAFAITEAGRLALVHE